MASQGSNYESYQKVSVVRGHHIYKVIWTPEVGEDLQLRPEDHNEHDTYAVAVVKGGSIVGHACSTFYVQCLLVFLEARKQNDLSNHWP